MVVYISLLSSAPPSGVRLPWVCDQVVHLDLTLLYILFLKTSIISIFLCITFLLISILMIDTIIEVLVIEFFVVAVKLSNPWVESDHEVFVLHHPSGHLEYLIGCLITSLGVEWTQNYRS